LDEDDTGRLHGRLMVSPGGRMPRQRLLTPNQLAAIDGKVRKGRAATLMLRRTIHESAATPGVAQGEAHFCQRL
jgi:hypothetical protein